MAITQTNYDETFDREGNLLSRVERVVDITADVITYDLHDRARRFLDANRTFLAIPSPNAAQNAAQVQRLTRECSALIRLLVGADLLAENTDT